MTEATLPQHPEHPDNFNRRGYTDMALRIYGGYAPSKLEIEKSTKEESFHVSIEQIRSAEKVIADYIDVERSDGTQITNDELQADCLIKTDEEEC